MTDKHWKLVGLTCCLASAVVTIWLMMEIYTEFEELLIQLKIYYGGKT